MIPRKRVMFVFGTRPEAIKMAPLILGMRKYPDVFEPIVVVTAQHREMLDQVLNLFMIKPQYDLGIMEKGQTLSGIITKALQGLEEVFLRERPDIILVQGDTSTTFAASLAAFYHRISIGHVEAGLRTHKKYNPFPEECNRRLTGVLADFHFTPTRTSLNNLLNEGVDRSLIYLTGNTVIDALHLIASKDYDLKGLDLRLDPKKKIILVTAHRRESFGLPLKNICEAVKIIAQKYKDSYLVILPVHKNPLVQDTVNQALGNVAGVQLINPIDYEPFIHLMKSSHIILSDSGGIQEEAPSLGKPVLVMRETTERPEAVEAGTVKIVGTDTEKIVRETEILINESQEYERMSKAINPYGDGMASERIIGILLHHFGFIDRKPEEFKAVR